MTVTPCWKNPDEFREMVFPFGALVVGAAAFVGGEEGEGEGDGVAPWGEWYSSLSSCVPLSGEEVPERRGHGEGTGVDEVEGGKDCVTLGLNMGE